MEINDKYTQSKKNYNSIRSSIQIDKELHKKVKEYCMIHNIKLQEFLESLISEKINATFNKENTIL